MPTNLCGPGDSFHPDRSHVIPGMMRRFHEAKVKNLPEVAICGSGTPKREFLHVDDLAEALFVLLERYSDPQTINVGTGIDVTIRELADGIKRVVGYAGEIRLDTSKPDGTPRKVLDVGRILKLGWKPTFTLDNGLETTYRWALEHGVFGDVVLSQECTSA